MSAQPRKVVHPDIKPENTPELASRYLDVPNMPWEPTKFPGIRIKVLYTDASGITTALFKLEPGAVVPLHEHTALEQTYVIEGSLEDHEGKCGSGQFVWRPAGNQHEAVAPNGAAAVNFAFDVTPAELVTAIVTEAGVLRPPYETSIAISAPVGVSGSIVDLGAAT